MSKKKIKIKIKADPFAEREAAKYPRPIPSREFILQHLKERNSPLDYQALIQDLGLFSEEEQFALHRRLKAMVREKELERMRGGYFWPAGARTLVKGRVHIEKNKKNQAWLIPEDGSARVFLHPSETHAIYHGNQIVASVINIETPTNIREGHLVEILEQQRRVVTGRFVVEKNVHYVIPHGKDFNQDILIPPNRAQTAKDGDIVVVEIEAQVSRFTEPLGQIVEILGHEDAPGIEILAAVRAYDLPEKWSMPVLKEIEGMSEEVHPAAKRDRFDLRHLPLVTIDGEDAKDFDDAVFCARKPRGGWQLYVAIADVSHYVKPNTALDIEARLRGNSVYFPGKVIPMLPEVLSNGLCSLKPEVDRLCLVCVMNINVNGKLVSYEFHEGIMRSKSRLTYTKVAALLAGTSEHLALQYAELLPHLKELKSLYQALRSERELRGAIEFETLETRIIFGKEGKISRIEPVKRNDAHRIIEECMLCANVATARFLKKNKLPSLYRIHEGPPEEKLNDLKTFLQELGLSLGGGAEPKPLDYAKLLGSIQNRPDANVIQTVLLRSLSQAVYSPDNLGHFGLAYTEYCHFTSPIRRYPDLLVHRQIRTVLRNKWDEKMRAESRTKEAMEALVQLGDHCSSTERRADEATRDAVRWLKCEYIAKQVGNNFTGIISGVTRFGFFVELKDIYIDGLVHVTSLRNDYYYFDQIHHRLIGERTGIVYKLGDTVQVSVSRVDIHERKIDFELLGSEKGEKGEKGKKGRGTGKGAKKEQIKIPRKGKHKEQHHEPKEGKKNQRKGEKTSRYIKEPDKKEPTTAKKEGKKNAHLQRKKAKRKKQRQRSQERRAKKI